ncbi:hypothetical protein, partial [Streptococcus iniae]|uniref:hypothetical protein n=1 Tax=Streptococcus iniae TaxID=1346 RepID=UPI001C7D4B7B
TNIQKLYSCVYTKLLTVSEFELSQKLCHQKISYEKSLDDKLIWKIPNKVKYTIFYRAII